MEIQKTRIGLSYDVSKRSYATSFNKQMRYLYTSRSQRTALDVTGEPGCAVRGSDARASRRHEPEFSRAEPRHEQAVCPLLHRGGWRHQVHHPQAVPKPQAHRIRGARRWIGRGESLVPSNFFFWSHLKSLVFETQRAKMEDHTTVIVVSSVGIASLPDLFERV
ncbi:hypothetical protein TNCV_3412731 [Trichonephila clavipes]|uniref:Uncharacterized protein n=1 Tax=Trichonephila clavipes TaxID=2585209 RepID=A0A8X6RGW3_TRICX|nr:hypothetical protein TNCV_3412731 [Trichonephila clavipes]